MRRRRATVQWRHLVNWREAARCGEWAEHFLNASCYVNELNQLLKMFVERCTKLFDDNQTKNAQRETGQS